jgi:aromatic ring hydroxylase
MIIKVKQTLIEEGVVNHFKQNYGKYLAGAGALGLGALNLAGRGYLGVENQDYVQDKIVPIVHDLRAGALMDDNQSTINSYAKAAKIDNILGPEELSDTANKQSYVEPGTYTSTAKNTAASLLSNISGLDRTEAINYGIRHPIDSLGRGLHYGVKGIQGVVKGVTDRS